MFEQQKDPVHANQILLSQVLVTSNKTVYCVVYIFIVNATFICNVDTHMHFKETSGCLGRMSCLLNQL